MNNSLKDSQRKVLGGALVALSILLISSLFLQWGRLEFEYASGDTSCKINISFNGFGKGSFYYHLSEKGGFSKTGTPPISIGLVQNVSLLILLLSFLTLLIGVNFIDSMTKRVLPSQIRNFLEKYWSKLILFTGVFFLTVFIIFSSFLLDLTVQIPSEIASQLGAGGKPFHMVYRSFTNYYQEVIRKYQIGKLSIITNVRLGLGAYLFLGAGIGLLYIYYLYFITKKEDWPEKWQKAGIFLPLLLVSNFLPILTRLSQDSGEMVELMAAPGILGYGGIIFLIFTVLLTYQIRSTALLESKTNDLQMDIYASEDIKEYELEEKIEALEETREKRKLNNIIVGILQLTLFIVTGFIMVGIVQNYQAFMSNAPFPHMHATPLAPIALFTPIAMLVTQLLFGIR